MEFRYGLWAGVSSIFGEDGRQLGECNTRPVIFDRHVHAETRVCKYEGSRNGDLINVSALRTAMSHFYEACAVTVAVRDYHMIQSGRSIEDQPGIWDLHVISRASLALIAYRYRAGKLSADELLANDLANQFKFVTGLFVTTREMTNAAHPAIKTNSLVSAQELFDFVDDNDHFRSEAGMVCAGSTSKIIEFMDIAIQGRNHSNSAKIKLDGADDHLAVLSKFVPDLDSWYRYALLTVELDSFVEGETFRRQKEAEPQNQDHLQSVLDICHAKHQYWLKLLGSNEQDKQASFKEGVLARQNAMLALLNLPQVKNLSDRMIKSRLGL